MLAGLSVACYNIHPKPANLKRSNLKRSNLKRSNLKRSNLKRSNLKRSNLKLTLIGCGNCYRLFEEEPNLR
jgi:uncharacterized protein YjbI with pentapeptide repeats